MIAAEPRDRPAGAVRGRVAPAALAGIAAALVAELALHLFEPDLGMTWAYAHLGRGPLRVASAIALAAVLPALLRRAWRSPWGRLPPLRPPAWAALAAPLALWLVLAAIGALWPAFPLTIDALWFRDATVRETVPAPRWVLAVAAMRAAAALRPEAVRVETFVVVANAGWSGLALCALAGCARLLARDRREQALIAALAWTAFGTLQVAIGYMDVYPVAVAGVALFLWTSLRALRGESHPAWAAAIAAVGPFFYLGLLLLWPPAGVLLGLLARDRRRRPAVAVAIVAAVAVAGLATLPQSGRPFAWGAFLETARAGSAFEAGYSPHSSLLPLWYLTARRHLLEVASTILLVDPVGPLLAAVAGTALVAERGLRAIDAPLAVLASFVAGWLAYLLVMDAAFGAYADWDLFSFGAAGTSLLGAACLVRLARDRGDALGAIAGLALAVAAVHLLARLNALEVDAKLHLRESPAHVLMKGTTDRPRR